MTAAYDDDETLVLRSMAHRMSQGIETRTRKHKLFSFDNVFIGTVRTLVYEAVAMSRALFLKIHNLLLLYHAMPFVHLADTIALVISEILKPILLAWNVRQIDHSRIRLPLKAVLPS